VLSITSTVYPPFPWYRLEIELVDYESILSKYQTSQTGSFPRLQPFCYFLLNQLVSAFKSARTERTHLGEGQQALHLVAIFGAMGKESRSLEGAGTSRTETRSSFPTPTDVPIRRQY
jgi:hypothetical protein